MIDLRKVFDMYTGDPHQLAAIDMLARAMPAELLKPTADWLVCYEVECGIIETSAKGIKKEWQ